MKKYLSLAAVLCVFAYFLAARWMTLQVVTQDALRTLFESYRIVGGEVIYRDFGCQYPPLAPLILAGFMRVFGATFLAGQLYYAVFGLINVVLWWFLAERLLPERLRLVCVLLIVAFFGASNEIYALFSVAQYTCTVTLGFAFFSLYLIGLLDRQAGIAPRRAALLMIAGATGCLLTKPEFVLGVLGSLAVAGADAATRPHGRAELPALARTAVLCFLPGAVFYAMFGAVTGYKELINGLTGCGVVPYVNTWLPTGIGLVYMLYHLCVGAALLLAVPLLAAARAGRLPLAVRLGGVALATLAIAAVLGRTPLHVATDKTTLARYLIRYPLYARIGVAGALAALLPLAARLRRGVTPETARLALLSVVVVMLNLRGLFQTHLSPLPDTVYSAIPYAVFWLFLASPPAARALARALGMAADDAARLPILSALQAFGGVLCFLQFALLWNHNVDNFSPGYLHTRAGTIRTDARNVSDSPEMWVESRLAPGDYFADFSYGQSVCFMAHLKSPLYSTQFSLLCPPHWMRGRDLSGMRAHPPRYVLFDEPKKIIFGTGEPTLRSFPYLVWEPTGRFEFPNETFPVLDYVLRTYRETRPFPRQELYERDDASTPDEVNGTNRPKPATINPTRSTLHQGDF